MYGTSVVTFDFRRLLFKKARRKKTSSATCHTHPPVPVFVSAVIDFKLARMSSRGLLALKAHFNSNHILGTIQQDYIFIDL